MSLRWTRPFALAVLLLTGAAGAQPVPTHPPLPVPTQGPHTSPASSSIRLDEGLGQLDGSYVAPNLDRDAARVVTATGEEGPVGGAQPGPAAIKSGSVTLPVNGNLLNLPTERDVVQLRESVKSDRNAEVLGRVISGDDLIARPVPLQVTEAGEIEPAILLPNGAPTDSEVWRRLRHGEGDLRISARGPQAQAVIQSSGMDWVKFRRGPLAQWGGALIAVTLLALLAFYILRGRIRLDHGRSGVTIQRFEFIERFGHWLMALSFLLLAMTGLFQLFGRLVLLPLIGDAAFSAFYVPLAQMGKWVHNNVSWAFMIGLVLCFVMWVAHNIPGRLDWIWIKQGGGIMKTGVHPPAKKFNFGQKLIFWGVTVLGVSISLTGLELLFPMQFDLFGGTFGLLNDWGIPQFFTGEAWPSGYSWQAEMQLAQGWHAIIAMLFVAIVLAHMYIGTVGMEGAFDAMSTGEVDVEWAREHHSIWYEEKLAADDKTSPARAHPAE